MFSFPLFFKVRLLLYCYFSSLSVRQNLPMKQSGAGVFSVEGDMILNIEIIINSQKVAKIIERSHVPFTQFPQ